MERTLILQNRHWNGHLYSGLSNRTVMNNLLDKQNLPHIQILTGVRRCGKSTVFKLLINDLMGSGVPPKAILNINLDAPVFIPFWDGSRTLDDIVEATERLTGVKVEYLFLDEVQQLSNWEVYVKSAYDAQVFKKIYITGSNSNLLQNHFSAMLSGRYFANQIRPFDIKECMTAHNINSLLDAYQNKHLVNKLMSDILAYGTFPEIILSKKKDDTKAELLKSYFESIVQKDCIVYNAVRDSQTFYKTTNYLLTNVGNRFSLPQLGKMMGSNETTMNNYIEYLCNSYICADIRNFSFSQKETKRSEHKCYCIDNGLMQANTQRFSPDSGRFFENLVFNELVNKGYTNISFANGGGECDFIAMKGGDIHCFQACYELNDSNRHREINGFSTSSIEAKTKTLITFNQKEQIDDIRVIPLWEWAIEA